MAQKFSSVWRVSDQARLRLQTVETDQARHDEELVRLHSSPGQETRIIMGSGKKKIAPIGSVNYCHDAGPNYLTPCFSNRWDSLLFDDFPNTDACLVVHDVDKFCERMHSAVKSKLPDWAGMDGPVLYGGSSPLGAVFSKPLQFIAQQEWRLAWRPPTAQNQLAPIKVLIGNMEQIAKLVPKPSQGAA